jgi:rubrerythrin
VDILKNFKDELFNELIYRELSNAERDAGIKRALALLSAMEESHASIFERMAERRGVKLKGLSGLRHHH